MSYMLLFKNRNGIVMAADTRYTKCIKIGNSKYVNDNGRKIAFDANAKICISMTGATSYNVSTGGTFYLQPTLQSFITKDISHYLTMLQNSNITLDKFIFYFLQVLIANQYLTIKELADFVDTYLTGIILHGNNVTESVEVDIAKLCPLIESQNKALITNQLSILCKYKTYQQLDLEVITGGDHLLSWISEYGFPPPLNFTDQCKKDITNDTLLQLRIRAVNAITNLIANNNNPFVGTTIGGKVDCIEMDYSGKYAVIMNSTAYSGAIRSSIPISSDQLFR